MGCRDGGLCRIEFAAETVDMMGVIAHGLEEVTLAMEARFLGLEDGSIDLTWVVVREMNRRRADPVQREVGNRGGGGVEIEGPGSGGRRPISGGRLGSAE